MHPDLHSPLRPRCVCLVGAALGFALATGAPLTAEPPRSDIQSVGDVAAAERRSPATGLVTARAPDVLREQLGLERGAGLVVEAVAVGSRAERAGLRRHDVLVSLDDQLLVLPEQLSALVAASRPQAPLVIDVRRAGKAIAVALSEATATTAEPSPAAGVVPATPPPARDPARAAPSVGEPASLPAANEALPMVAPDPIPDPIPDPAIEPAQLPADFVPPPGARRLGPNAVVLENRDCWLKVYRDTETCLMVRDSRGWLLFNGPIATPKQRSLIPRRVRDRVIQLEQMLDTVAARRPSPSPSPVPPATKPAPLPPNDEPVAEIGSLDVAPIEIR